MAFCVKCGRQINEGASFCSGCGNPVTGSAAKEVEGIAVSNGVKAEPESDAKENADAKGEKNSKAVKIIIIVASVIGGVALLIGGLIILVMGLLNNFKRDISERIETHDYGFIQETETHTGETITSGMNNIGFLCTSTYYYTHAESYSDTLYFEGYAIPGTTTSFVYTCDGVITAGVDFSQAVVEVDEDTGVITVTLPAAVIYSNDIDEDSFQILDNTTGLFNSLDLEAVTTSFTDMKHEEEDKALDKGILEDAEKYAALIVENFINGMNLDGKYKIAVVFEKPKVE